MPWLDGIADGLPDAMTGKHRGLQVVACEEVELVLAVLVLAESSLHLEVIAPRDELQSLVTPVARLGRQLRQRQVGPGAREQDDWP
jgi:hypothetical protein